MRFFAGIFQLSWLDFMATYWSERPLTAAFVCYINLFTIILHCLMYFFTLGIKANRLSFRQENENTYFVFYILLIQTVKGLLSSLNIEKFTF